ncbi:MAG: hypothetical protein KIT19_13795 [Phycisphaeraceae bacterium]|nr:hypothetical protein [Phycisphaeraceae bacterium]
MMKTTLTAAAIATIAGAASADIVTMKFLGTGAGQNVKWRLNGGSETSTFAGQLRHDITSGTGIGADWVGEHLTYCTDIYQYVSNSYKTFDIVSLDTAPNSNPMGAGRAQALYDVFSIYAPMVIEAGINNELAAAFQVAIWEIVTDFNPGVGVSSLNVDSGNFKLTKVNGSSSRSAAFNNHLTDIFGAIGVGAATNLVALTNGGAQDQLFYIPAPGPLALAGTGLFMLARRRR